MAPKACRCFRSARSRAASWQRSRSGCRPNLLPVAIAWCTFDCYGTLIDWEGGVADALLPLFPDPKPDRDALAREYIETEATVESGAYLRYRDVLERAGRALLLAHGIDRPSPLPASLPAWRAFLEFPAAVPPLQPAGRP